MFLGLIALTWTIEIKCVNTSQQTADIQTKGSFHRQRWTQLRHMLNLMTPRMHSCSHFSVLYWSIQTDHKMSKRHAELVTESATVKQRPVRVLSSRSKFVFEFKCELQVESSPAERRTAWTRMCKNRKSRADKTVLSGCDEVPRVRGPDVAPQTSRQIH